MSNAQDKGNTRSLKSLPRLDGKTIVITGANSGIGFEMARVFARAGARVVLACRSAEKAGEAIGRIRAETPDADLLFMTIDLASLASVRAFAQEASERLPRIDVLCNNAGVMALPYSQTRDGFEMQFGINHLGHFALTGLLLESIVASAPSRIVTVSSSGHRGGKILFDDLQGTRHYNKWHAYGRSKLANLLFAYEMDRRLRARGLDVKSVACHPGVAKSNLYQGAPLWLKLVTLPAQPARMGALPEIYAALGEDVESGDYIGPSGFMESRGLPKKVQSSAMSHDVELAKRLWTVCEDLTGVSFLN